MRDQLLAMSIVNDTVCDQPLSKFETKNETKNTTETTDNWQKAERYLFTVPLGVQNNYGLPASRAEERGVSPKLLVEWQHGDHYGRYCRINNEVRTKRKKCRNARSEDFK